jgi:hypothetical protein
MGETIKIDINKLNSALTKLDTLATSIDSQRRSAMSNSPIALPSLEDGALGATSKFLTDQKPELQTRLDLAKLLDQDGDGQASYTVENGDQLWEVKRALSDEMTKQLKDLDVNSKDSRERATLLAEMLNRYKDDPDIPWQVMNALGPEGVTTVMNKLKNLVGQYGETYWQTTDNPGEEHQALIALQESMGNGLSLMFSSASTYMDSKWGKEIAQDPWAATVMMRYIDKANKDIDPMVFEAMGVELKDREHNDPMIWSQMFGPDANNFGEQNWKNFSPLREYLNVADNSTRDAQAVMGNEDLLRYFTSERQDYDHLSDQAGKVLGVATVDAAYSDNYQYAMKAAQISSNLLHELGGDAKPLDGVKEEVGGIIATYIADADRVHEGNNDPGDPGYHLWGPPDYDYGYGLGDESGIPKYGIKLTQGDLRGALEDIGDNDAAVSAVGKATSILNAARFEYGAAHQKDDPGSMHKAAHEGSTLTGFMTDSLVNGDIDSEEEAAAERKKVAEMFTAPIDLIKTDSIPVIGDLIKGEVKDAIVEGYTADKTSDAIQSANDAQGKGITLTQLQALYAMEKHDVPTGISDWPQEHGEPKSPENLTPEELHRVMSQADKQTGVTSDVTGEIENSWDDYNKKYGDN